ncbi:Hypothetical predicted protein, partial [Paramuricea clavata]
FLNYSGLAGYADDTGKVNFGVRLVDADVFVEPKCALDVSADEYDVPGEYALL